MIKTYSVLIDELSNYSNPKTKIQRMVKNHELFYVCKGLYTTTNKIEPYCLAQAIYDPSYISFQTALSYYGLIPERTFAVTCATFKKNKRKEFETQFARYIYQDVPSKVFPFGIKLIENEECSYKIATKEKAILDMLYITSPIHNMKEMNEYLFENMRINYDNLLSLDKELLYELGELYKSKNITLFINMMKKEKLHD